MAQSSSQRAWIFQANPHIYDIAGAFHALTDFHWSVNQYKTEIKRGDIVYLWMSGPNGGLIGSGFVDSEVGKFNESEEEKAFWRTTPEDDSESLRVRIVKDRELDKPISRETLKAEPGLAELSFLKASHGTNFSLTPQESAVLSILMSERPGIEEIVRRLESQKIVFQSTQQGAAYCIHDVRADGCSLSRLSAASEERMPFTMYERAYQRLKEAGGSTPYSDFVSNTVAHRIGVLRGPRLDLSVDRRTVVLLDEEEQLLKHFCKLITNVKVDGSSGSPKLYKPALLAAIIDAISDGLITENKIDFNFIEPLVIKKLEGLGQPGGSQQVAYAFVNLANDLFWMLGYKDVENRIESSNISPGAIRNLVDFGTLKDDYWWLLRSQANRKACLDALAQKWWPNHMENRTNFWWVNQGQAYAGQRQEEIIWAPKKNAAGKTLHHWDNVLKVKKGDIVFNYAKGEIKAVSIATEDGGEHELPEVLNSEANNWITDGYLAKLTYFDLEPPLPRDEVADGIRKLKSKYGPINRTGAVNQGYLFGLEEAAARIIAEKLDLDKLPSEVADPLRKLIDDQWAMFVHWGRRFFETAGVREESRSRNLGVIENLSAARSSLDSDDEAFLSALKSAFGPPNKLTFNRSTSDLLSWGQKNANQTRKMLRQLWNEDIDYLEALAEFQKNVPYDALKGPGTRTNVASYLGMLREPTKWPVFWLETFLNGCKLTGYPVSPGEELEIYPHAIGFLDRIIEECGKRGFQLEDRLDAQCILWCVMNEKPPESWTEDEQQEFLDWREGKMSESSVKSGLSELAERLLLDVECLEEIERLLTSKGQLIFYGPPGTGKTYVAREIARYYAADDGVEIVQFHPSYTYEDFVEGYRPALKNGQPGFDIVAGPLREIAQKAEQNPEQTYVLLIDEINRGNIAKVFGELYFLLEYRDEKISLQYNRESKFGLPKNLWLIGTMNTADRSIALMDSALRRRFYFYPFFPDEEPISNLLRTWLEINKPELVWLADVVDLANEKLGDRHGAIGPSYFLRDDLDEDWVGTIWKHAILPYLAEQFFGEEERLVEFGLENLKASQSSETQGITDASDQLD